MHAKDEREILKQEIFYLLYCAHNKLESFIIACRAFLIPFVALNSN